MMYKSILFFALLAISSVEACGNHSASSASSSACSSCRGDQGSSSASSSSCGSCDDSVDADSAKFGYTETAVDAAANPFEALDASAFGVADAPEGWPAAYRVVQLNADAGSFKSGTKLAAYKDAKGKAYWFNTGITDDVLLKVLKSSSAVYVMGDAPAASTDAAATSASTDAAADTSASTDANATASGGGGGGMIIIIIVVLVVIGAGVMMSQGGEEGAEEGEEEGAEEEEA